MSIFEISSDIRYPLDEAMAVPLLVLYGHPSFCCVRRSFSSSIRVTRSFSSMSFRISSESSLKDAFINGTELVRRPPSLCLAPCPPRPLAPLPRALTGTKDPVESLLPRLRAEPPPPNLPGRLLAEFPVSTFLRSRFEPPLVFAKLLNEPLEELLDRVSWNLRFWAFAAPAERLVRRKGIWSKEACRERIPADSKFALWNSLQLFETRSSDAICFIMFARTAVDKPLPAIPRPRIALWRLTLLSRLFIICLRRNGFDDEPKSIGVTSRISLLMLLMLLLFAASAMFAAVGEASCCCC